MPPIYYSPGAKLILEALGKLEDEREFIELDVAALALSDLPQHECILSGILRRQDVWDETLRVQLRQAVSEDRQYAYLRRSEGRVGFRLQLALEQARKIAEQEESAIVYERHLARALVEQLSRPLKELGINGEQLLRIIDLLSPEERELTRTESFYPAESAISLASPVRQFPRQEGVERYTHAKAHTHLNPAMTVLGLVRVIQDWHPRPFKSEREYQTLLYDHIKEHLPEGSTVQKNYLHAGMVVDLYVRLQAIGGVFEVFIELKRNLTNPECNRLIGQIHQIGLRHNIVVVLAGKAAPALVGRLREEFVTYLSKGVTWGQPSMFIVEKSLKSPQ